MYGLLPPQAQGLNTGFNYSCRGVRGRCPLLLITYSHLLRSAAYSELIAHSLNLRVLFLNPRNQYVDPVFKLSDCRFLFLNLAILFLAPRVFLEKLVKQHCVDLLVANGFGLAFRVAPNQIGIHFGHFLRDQSKGNRLRLIILFVIAEADRLKRIDRFTGFVHWLNVMFVPARRDVRPTKSAVAVYGNQVWIDPNLRLNVGIDLADKTAVAHVLTKATDGNNVIGSTDGAAGGEAQRDIAVAAAVVTQCNATDGGVARAAGIIKERVPTDGRICGTG